MRNDGPEMRLEDVLEILEIFRQSGIEVCIDGGWAVDALLGKQTRQHEDLDIAVEHKDVGKIWEILEARGFKEVPRGDSWACNFVLGDERARLVDVHSYTVDADGKCVFGLPYPAECLTGTGVIGGRGVKCISAEWLVKFHSGYKLDANDYLDVKALCVRFGMELPGEFAGFEVGD